jgi:hypothetical protein
LRRDIGEDIGEDIEVIFFSGAFQSILMIL